MDFADDTDCQLTQTWHLMEDKVNTLYERSQKLSVQINRVKTRIIRINQAKSNLTWWTLMSRGGNEHFWVDKVREGGGGREKEQIGVLK